MKFTWEEKDIQVGVFFHRGFEEGEKPEGDYSYAMSTLAKIGFMQHFDEDVGDAILRKDKDGRKLFTVTSMTDGLTMIMSARALVKMLNEGGYRRTQKSDMAAMVESLESTSYLRLL